MQNGTNKQKHLCLPKDKEDSHYHPLPASWHAEVRSVAENMYQLFLQIILLVVMCHTFGKLCMRMLHTIHARVRWQSAFCIIKSNSDS
jgi:hypothetical protein